MLKAVTKSHTEEKVECDNRNNNVIVVLCNSIMDRRFSKISNCSVKAILKYSSGIIL